MSSPCCLLAASVGGEIPVSVSVLLHLFAPLRSRRRGHRVFAGPHCGELKQFLLLGVVIFITT
jgi:hypothetical protein